MAPGYPPQYGTPSRSGIPSAAQTARRHGVVPPRQPPHDKVPAMPPPNQTHSHSSEYGQRTQWTPNMPRRSGAFPGRSASAASSRSPHRPLVRVPRDERPRQHPLPTRTDPSLYQWDRLTTAQQQAVLRTIRMSQRGRRGQVVLMVLVALTIVGLLVVCVLMMLWMLHHGGVAGIVL